MLEIRGGKTALETFCACLNIRTPMIDETYNNTLKTVKDELECQAKESTKAAASEEKEDDSERVTECKAMFDGT